MSQRSIGFINNLGSSPLISIREACRLMKVSRSGYLAWNDRNPKSDGFEEKLRCALRRITEEFHYYGYKRIYRLMAEEKLLNKRKRFKPVTTQSNHDFPKYSNLANIKRFIEEVYNKKQLHSGIGYVPPEEFEMMKKLA